MGRIPNFTDTIFPQTSIHLLTLTSTIGIVFYLFIVAIELDASVAKRNAKASIAISVTGLAIPLGLGAAIAVPMYHNFVDSSVNYGYFILFVAVAVGITAFPVLCRILTETRLLDTTVGVLVLSAGIANDVTGWILLALTVALVNASSGITAFYVLLSGAGYTLFLLLPVRWAFRWIARKTGCLEKGEPTAFMMTVILVLVLISAFFTDIIGIHPIFGQLLIVIPILVVLNVTCFSSGGFIAGLVIPKDNGFAISVVEKLEDFIGLLLIPQVKSFPIGSYFESYSSRIAEQYFALSGLRTNLGLLDTGKTWGYTILICVVAFLAKFIPCSMSAKVFGFNRRESGAVGALMACKG
jgi:Kef-type K+ transport system membrane component KefB